MELSSFGLLFRLIFAHFLADFILQSKGMANGKRGFQIIKKKKRQLSTAHKWAYHLSHSLVQAITAYLFAGMWSNWMIPLVIFVTHLIIDYIKIRYFNDRLHAFIIDQILHLLVICILWMGVYGIWSEMAEVSDILFTSPKWWAILTAYLLILKPTSLLLALFTQQWREPGMNSTSLQNAGQWIGYLERCLILTFILVGFNEAIGFLLAAKSIFRFRELSKGQEIKTTEYVLIGTLASFTIAILTGLVLRTFLSAYT